MSPVMINGAIRRVPEWAVFSLTALPGLWVVAQAAGAPDPVKTLELGFGDWALRLLMVTLAVTPLRQVTGVDLRGWRRALGVSAFGYGCVHLGVWIALDMALLWPAIAAEIGKRPYIIVGLTALVLMLPLAVTSVMSVRRRMGPRRWRALHRLTYPVGILAIVHMMMVGKVVATEAIVWACVLTLLLALRLGTRLAAARATAGESRPISS